MQRPGSGPDSLWSPARRGLTTGLVLTITLVAFEALAISTVLPIVARDLGDLEHYGWVFTSFFLGSLIGIAVVGGVINRGGLGRPLAVGLGLFAIGLLLGGLAMSMPMLIGARFIQGLGAGTIPPIAYVAIGRSLPESLRPRMFAILSTAWVLPGVIGPAIAGVVGETLGWRYVFLGLLPLIGVAGILTIRAVSKVVPRGPAADAEAEAAAAERHRFPNALGVALGAGLVMLGLTPGHGGIIPVDTEPVVTLVLIAAGLLVGIPPLRRLTPPGTLTAQPILPAAVLLRGVMTFTFFAVDAYVTLTLESWRGLSAVAAGVVLTAATISWTAGSWIQARNAGRWSSAQFVRAGMIITVIGLISFSTILAPSVPVAFAVPTFAVAGLGMGLGYAPLSLIVLRESPPETQGAASSALSLSDTLGTALGTGVSGAIVAASIRSTGAPVDGLVGAFWVAIFVGIGGVLLTGRLRGRSTAGATVAVPAPAPQV